MSASSLKVKYTHGKVEAADLELKGPDSVSLVEVNASIEHNFLIATGKGSRTELSSTENHTTWRLGSLSVSKWPSLNECWIHSGSLLCSTKTEEPIKISSTTDEKIILEKSNGITFTAREVFKPSIVKYCAKSPNIDKRKIKKKSINKILDIIVRYGINKITKLLREK